MDGSSIEGMVGAGVAVAMFIATLISRWSKTNPENPWYVRLSTVLDATQIIDSTRKLDE